MEFLNVASAKVAAILAKYSALDYRINLEEGKTPPFGPIYPLAEKELKILYDYLKSSTI